MERRHEEEVVVSSCRWSGCGGTCVRGGSASVGVPDLLRFQLSRLRLPGNLGAEGWSRHDQPERFVDEGSGGGEDLLRRSRLCWPLCPYSRQCPVSVEYQDRAGMVSDLERSNPELQLGIDGSWCAGDCGSLFPVDRDSS